MRKNTDNSAVFTSKEISLLIYIASNFNIENHLVHESGEADALRSLVYKTRTMVHDDGKEVSIDNFSVRL